MRADQVRVADPAVIDRLARLHRCLQLLDHVAFLNQVVLDLNAGDLAERLGQHLAFVLVRGDGFGHHGDALHALGLQLLGRFDEPLHLGHLLVLVQRRRLKLAVNPLLGFGLASPACLPQSQGCYGESNRLELHLHCMSPQKGLPVFLRIRASGEERAGSLPAKEMCDRSTLAHDERQHQHRNHKADPHRRLGLQ
ncbi:hypothetical protein SDC9_82151 [bioreactor metagenome]|uniref:Uncharacterized protein n=1 Tax=bioreactor metagenome TaxID=1076179 RepID=A0A644Z5K3_9ZZZZ